MQGSDEGFRAHEARAGPYYRAVALLPDDLLGYVVSLREFFIRPYEKGIGPKILQGKEKRPWDLDQTQQTLVNVARMP